MVLRVVRKLEGSCIDQGVQVASTSLNLESNHVRVTRVEHQSSSILRVTKDHIGVEFDEVRKLHALHDVQSFVPSHERRRMILQYLAHGFVYFAGDARGHPLKRLTQSAVFYLTTRCCLGPKQTLEALRAQRLQRIALCIDSAMTLYVQIGASERASADMDAWPGQHHNSMYALHP